MLAVWPFPEQAERFLVVIAPVVLFCALEGIAVLARHRPAATRRTLQLASLGLVIATALMAIARKVIVLDFEKTNAEYILAIAAVVIALGVTHWLLSREDTPFTTLDQLLLSTARRSGEANTA